MYTWKNIFERLPKPRWFVFYSVFPFAISFAKLSRCRFFLSRRPCVWNMLSRAFAEVPGKNLLGSLAYTYWNFCSWTPPPPASLLFLDLALNRELQISVGTAGPQPRAPDFSPQLQPAAKNLNGQCRTPTAIARSQWAQQTTQAQDLSWHCNYTLSNFWGVGHPS